MFEGAGVLTGDLTPECAAVVTAVLDALSAPAGAEDTRTYGQRYHDALQEAMRRLVASDLLPERAGQPVKVVAHIALADLLLMDGSSALQEEWIASARDQRQGLHFVLLVSPSGRNPPDGLDRRAQSRRYDHGLEPR